MMNIRTFQAIDMPSAVARIKEELGPNAVILGSRTIKKGEGEFGMISRPLIEVTAALDEEVAEERKKRRAPAGSAPEKLSSKKKEPGLDALASVLDPVRDELSALREMVGAATASGLSGSAELARAGMLAEEMERIKSMMSFLLENSSFYRGTGLDPTALVCYRRMVERGLEPEYALKLARRAKEEVPGNRELDLRTLVDQLISGIAEAFIPGEPIVPYSDGPRVAALVGPTGVGKTTTVAKIAARLTLEGRKVGLITIDTYRIAAAEQLKIYAGILGIPIEVAVAPEGLQTALRLFREKDVVLIDTAGRSQRDAKKLAELAGFLSDGVEIENYLVLSAAADPASLDEAARNFGCVTLAGLIFTKLDESAKPGVVISQNFKTGLPVLYCTTGQRVPEDIEAASGKKIAARIFKKAETMDPTSVAREPEGRHAAGAGRA